MRDDGVDAGEELGFQICLAAGPARSADKSRISRTRKRGIPWEHEVAFSRDRSKVDLGRRVFPYKLYMFHLI